MQYSNDEQLKVIKKITSNIPIMSNSRIHVSYDEQNFFWVIYDRTCDKLIKNPTKEDLNGTHLKKYNLTNICQVCREKMKRGEISEWRDKSILHPGNAFRDNNKEIEEWICSNCNSIRRQRLPGSQNNLLKSIRNRRTGNLKEYRNVLGDNCERLTSRLFGVKRLSVEYDNYSRLPLDHSPIPIGISVMIDGKLVDISGKVLETKGSIFSKNSEGWKATFGTGRIKKNYDILIFWCISKDGIMIERCYMIPKSEIIERCIKRSIKIIKYPLKSNSKTLYWYKIFRVNDENLLKDASETWKKIISKEIQ